MHSSVPVFQGFPPSTHDSAAQHSHQDGVYVCVVVGGGGGGGGGGM